MCCRVSTTTVGDRVVHHLHDDEAGSSASILPSYGFNLFDLRLPIGGEVRPVVACEPGWVEAPSRPARNGFPILFPFPGRIGNARYTFEGKSYDLVPNKPPHAIHGFALDAPWDVVEHKVHPQGATIVGRFQISKNAPAAVGRWPSDALLEVTYTLAGGILTMASRVENVGEGRLPWGLGIHSYFRLPFDRGGDFDRTRVQIPASRYWVLENGLPTGETRSVSDSPMDYRAGRPMAGLVADDALTDLERSSQGLVSCDLIDYELNANLRLIFHGSTREVVVFTPPDTPGVVAVEPYTQMADAFALAEKGIDAGLQVLQPGQESHLLIMLVRAATGDG